MSAISWTWSERQLNQGQPEMPHNLYAGMLALLIAGSLAIVWFVSGVAASMAFTGWLMLPIVCGLLLAAAFMGSEKMCRDEIGGAAIAMLAVGCGVGGLLSIICYLLTPLDFRATFLTTAGIVAINAAIAGLCLPEEEPVWWQAMSRRFGIAVAVIAGAAIELFSFPDLQAMAQGLLTAVFAGWVTRTMALAMGAVYTPLNAVTAATAVFRDLAYYADKIAFGEARTPRGT